MRSFLERTVSVYFLQNVIFKKKKKNKSTDIVNGKENIGLAHIVWHKQNTEKTVWKYLRRLLGDRSAGTRMVYTLSNPTHK